MTSTDAESDPDGEQPPAEAVRPPFLEWQERLRASPGFRAIALQTQAKRMGNLFLHNVLTAMSTRMDQQRRFMSKYFGEDPVLTRDYSEKITSLFTPSLEAAFLKGLRNYITHLQLPVHQSKQTITQQSFEVTFILPGKPLLTWDGWNGSMRAWITSQGEAVPIVDVVDAYAHINA